MMRLVGAAALVLLSGPLCADMYQDASNAVLPAARDNLGAVAAAAGGTLVGELASWSVTTGNALRQGTSATLTGAQTAGATADGFQLQLKNQISADADAFYIWTCVLGVCNTANPGNFDHNRIITIVPPGSTTDLQTSQSIYFINRTGRPGPPYSSFPVYVGQNIVGICDADGAGCWGGNSIISDNRGQGTPTPKPLRFMVGWEADFQVNSVNSQVAGFMTGGSSTVQPSSATGYSCLWLDGSSAQGNVAKWSTCLSSQHGSATVFALAGTQANDGANTPSQSLDMYYRSAANVLQHMSLAAINGDLLIANTAGAANITLSGAGAYRTGDNGGININNRVVLYGTGATFGVGSDSAYTEQAYSNAAATTSVYGSVRLLNVPTAAGAGGLAVCIDTAGVLYKKASCP